MDEKYRDRSVLIHGKFRSEKWDFEDHILPPITTSVSFRLRDAKRGAEGFAQFANPELDRGTLHPIYIYARLDDPCQALLEETLAFAEKGETAISFATGMAAVSAAIGTHVSAGDHILIHKTVYGCTYGLITDQLKRFGVEHSFVDFLNLDSVRKSVQPNTKVIYFESPCNPTMELIDIAGVTEIVRDANSGRSEDAQMVSIIDNTFATPFCQRPIEHGIDFVVHSLTKNIGGFGATMGGAVIGPRASETSLLIFRKNFGGSLSPKAAWDLLVYGVPTLALRVERQQQSALKVAEYLESHPKVSRVVYPGLASYSQGELARKQMRDIDGNFAPGSMIYFELQGEQKESYDSAVKLIDRLASESLSITLAVSLGQIRTLVEHPASMTHSAMPADDLAKAGIAPGGVRLSIGLEDVRDILGDLERSLAVV